MGIADQVLAAAAAATMAQAAAAAQVHAAQALLQAQQEDKVADGAEVGASLRCLGNLQNLTSANYIGILPRNMFIMLY